MSIGSSSSTQVAETGSNISPSTTGEGKGKNSIKPLEPSIAIYSPDPPVQKMIAAAVVIQVENEYIIFEGGRGWEFPGGKMERFDKNTLDTAIREVWEETGLRLERSRMREIGFIEHSDAKGHEYLCVVYHADYSGPAFHGSTMFPKWRFINTIDECPQLWSNIDRIYPPSKLLWDKYGVLFQAIALNLI